MTFLTLMPWLRRNAYDEDGRVWYEECISALKNADWDPLIPKGSKVKKVSAGPPRPSTPAVAGTTVVASTAAPAPKETPLRRLDRPLPLVSLAHFTYLSLFFAALSKPLLSLVTSPPFYFFTSYRQPRVARGAERRQVLRPPRLRLRWPEAP
ncbi:uncharacterized protein Pyn_34079 [Prunus yedoensis var. nudiflora]|uniref:Uncharacterized protein n=1 Tax=Prunus yedoensis var. nudiflora TaxID=2094558 RepID=A0A314XF47_PRUYE|nr:uncharacterized protein Pyn_34079 [Prunus yedoensis var. nudiflora]